MKKCKLSPATRKKWIRLINETLDKKEYGFMSGCPLCKESNVLDPYKGPTINRKNCIKNCIVVNFLRANNFEFMTTSYPCNDYFMQEYSKVIRNIRIQIVRSHLRQLKSWLKK